jgi:hypothetical protein
LLLLKIARSEYHPADSSRRDEVVRRLSRQRRGSSIASIDNADLAAIGVNAVDDNTDAMSVRTEDFETQFIRTMQPSPVKLVANTPISKFDQFIVDSDVDTVKSQSVRDTFQSALARQGLIQRQN